MITAMKLNLRKLSRTDGPEIYQMLKQISAVENSFTNPVFDMGYDAFQRWLIQQDTWSEGIDLPDGYVPQTIYWLYADNTPVGIGKIRHQLTPSSRNNGGNIGYAISRPYRGLGYGNVILRLLLDQARSMGINELLLTVDIGNEASKHVVEKNGGILVRQNTERYFYSFR
jgi:predicted acetyltransferase